MITRTALDHATLTTSWNFLSTHSVTIRAMDIDDLSIETEFLGKLTLETRHKRFLGPAIRPSASMALSAAKHIDQLTLAASITLDAGEEYLVSPAISATRPERPTSPWSSRMSGRAVALVGGCCRICANVQHVGAFDGCQVRLLPTTAPMLGLVLSMGFRGRVHPDGALLRSVTCDCNPRSAVTPS